MTNEIEILLAEDNPSDRMKCSSHSCLSAWGKHVILAQNDNLIIAKERFPTQPVAQLLLANGANHMSRQADLQLLTLAGVAHRCAQETERFFQRQSYDPSYCFELFRRAILDHNQRAWELVYAHYCPLVVGWVERHAAFPDSGEEAQYFVNRAFEKMWAALTPEKFGHFSDLKSILRYLQMCVHSAIIDFMRLKEPGMLLHDAEKSSLGPEAPGPTVEQHVLTRMEQEELWRWLKGRLKNEKEQRVVYGAFVLALKPRELYAQFPGTFRDVQEVYRVKENLVARLRRDDELRRFLDDALR